MGWADRVCAGQTGAVLVRLVTHAFPAAAVPARLWGGRSRCAGHLELFFNGTWGSVCTQVWDRAASRVLCRQLGCGRTRHVPAPCSPVAADTSPAVLRWVQCTGQEPALDHCDLQTGHPSPCPEDQVATVECEEPFQLRLVGGPRRCAGRLEVNRAGQWGTVCDDGWSGTNAAVVCRELGCGAVGPVGDLPWGRPHFGPGTGRIWLDDVRCRGQEGTLQDCAHRPWGYHDCTHQEDIGVVCKVSDPLPTTVGQPGWPGRAGSSRGHPFVLAGCLSTAALPLDSPQSEQLLRPPADHPSHVPPRAAP
ncbi:CD5 antigen-like [Leptosomus discolor]